MDVIDLLNRASVLLAQVPARPIAPETLEAYKRDFRRMWHADGDLDPLRPGDAIDTYYHYRAALHCIGAEMLKMTVQDCVAAIDSGEGAAIRAAALKLRKAVSRLEPAFALEPPQPTDLPLWDRAPSRWRALNKTGRRRGKNSKRNLLKELPRDWDRLIWHEVPADWPYRDALAVLLTVPVRSEELVSGERPAGLSPGVVLELPASDRMTISFMPVKSHGGLYGTQLTTFVIDSAIADEPVHYLAQRCRTEGGRLVVSVKSKNALRKAMTLLGKKALPNVRENITPNVSRHQLLADLKVTFGAGEAVAAAAGHGTDRTQAHYGHYQRGRQRRGYIDIVTARRPRTGAVDRVRQLKVKDLEPPSL